jgi:hypothetical protein
MMSKFSISAHVYVLHHAGDYCTRVGIAIEAAAGRSDPARRPARANCAWQITQNAARHGTPDLDEI